MAPLRLRPAPDLWDQEERDGAGVAPVVMNLGLTSRVLVGPGTAGDGSIETGRVAAVEHLDRDLPSGSDAVATQLVAPPFWTLVKVQTMPVLPMAWPCWSASFWWMTNSSPSIGAPECPI